MSDFEIEKRRLMDLIKDGIAPLVSGISIHKVNLRNSKMAIIIGIPRSWTSPHMVIIRGGIRFYSRNSSGKFPQNVSEIRTAFALSESIGDA